MLTGQQIRAARAALRLSVAELAHRSEISPATLHRIEAANGFPDTGAKTMVRIESALWAAGAIFYDHPDPDNSDGRIRGVFIKSHE